MRWFRDTIRQGTWLALIALAINLGLSFGHFHAIDSKVSGRGIAVTSIASTDDGQKQGHPNDSHADYLCPICMAATAMASPLASPPGGRFPVGRLPRSWPSEPGRRDPRCWR